MVRYKNVRTVRRCTCPYIYISQVKTFFSLVECKVECEVRKVNRNLKLKFNLVSLVQKDSNLKY